MSAPARVFDRVVPLVRHGWFTNSFRTAARMASSPAVTTAPLGGPPTALCAFAASAAKWVATCAAVRTCPYSATSAHNPLVRVTADAARNPHPPIVQNGFARTLGASSPE